MAEAQCGPIPMRRPEKRWAGSYGFTSHGVTIAVRSEDTVVLDLLPNHVPPGSAESSSVHAAHLYSVVRINEAISGRARYDVMHLRTRTRSRTRVGRALNRREVLACLESAWHGNVAASATGRLFVHAGVVAWRDQAIVIPGRTGSGKTSLVAALVRSGATYYSDEYAVLDLCGRVHPFAKPLSIRDRAGRSTRPVPVEALGGVAGVEPIPVGLIVATSYHPSATWSPRTISAGEALFVLLNHTVAARAQPEAALATLHCAVSGARALAGRRGSAEETAAAILEQFCECE